MTSSSNHMQKIGVVTATIVGVNAMIGAGIFSVPATLASSVGPAGIATYAFVIMAVWCMASSIARLAQLFPQEGSFYLYTKQWGGHTLGVIAAIAYLCGLLIAMGLLTQMAGAYLNTIFPFLSQSIWGTTTLAVLVLLNVWGVVLSQVGQYILVCCTIFPLIATTIMCFFHAHWQNLTPFMPYGYTNILAATRAVIFGFFGFECAASLFPIVKNPEKNVAKALTYSIMIVGSLYLLFVTSLILAIPLTLFNNAMTPLSEILRHVFPTYPWLIGIIHLSILSAIIGTIHSMIWSSSTLLVSYMHLFCPGFTQHTVSKSAHTYAVFFVGLCIFSTYSTISNPNVFFSLTALGIVFAYVTSIITLLTIPSERTIARLPKTLIGLATAIIILFFACEGLVYDLW